MPQRSPIIFWLLLAATASVDAIAFDAARSQSDHGMVGMVAYFGLLSGQLSAVCVWSAFRPQPSWWSRLVPIAAVFAASLAYVEAGQSELLQLLPYFASVAAVLLMALWFLRRSAYWQRRWSDDAKWQFSTAQLLILSTVVCVLAAALRSVNWYQGELGSVIAIFVCSIALAVLCTLIVSTSAHWLLRLAGVVAATFVCSLVFYGAVGGFLFVFARYQLLAQAIVLTAWLEWGGVLPVRRTAATTDVAGVEQTPSSPE